MICSQALSVGGAGSIETHRQNIFRKLELGNAAQLVRYAIREGLVKA